MENNAQKTPEGVPENVRKKLEERKEKIMKMHEGSPYADMISKVLEERVEKKIKDIEEIEEERNKKIEELKKKEENVLHSVAEKIVDNTDRFYQTVEEAENRLKSYQDAMSKVQEAIGSAVDIYTQNPTLNSADMKRAYQEIERFITAADVSSAVVAKVKNIPENWLAPWNEGQEEKQSVKPQTQPAKQTQTVKRIEEKTSGSDYKGLVKPFTAIANLLDKSMDLAIGSAVYGVKKLSKIGEKIAFGINKVADKIENASQNIEKTTKKKTEAKVETKEAKEEPKKTEAGTKTETQKKETDESIPLINSIEKNIEKLSELIKLAKEKGVGKEEEIRNVEEQLAKNKIYVQQSKEAKKYPPSTINALDNMDKKMKEIIIALTDALKQHDSSVKEEKTKKIQINLFNAIPGIATFKKWREKRKEKTAETSAEVGKKKGITVKGMLRAGVLTACLAVVTGVGYKFYQSYVEWKNQPYSNMITYSEYLQGWRPTDHFELVKKSTQQKSTQQQPTSTAKKHKHDEGGKKHVKHRNLAKHAIAKHAKTQNMSSTPNTKPHKVVPDKKTESGSNIQDKDKYEPYIPMEVKYNPGYEHAVSEDFKTAIAKLPSELDPIKRVILGLEDETIVPDENVYEGKLGIKIKADTKYDANEAIKIIYRTFNGNTVPYSKKDLRIAVRGPWIIVYIPQTPQTPQTNQHIGVSTGAATQQIVISTGAATQKIATSTGAATTN